MVEPRKYLELIVRFTFAFVIVCGCITLVRIGLCTLANVIVDLKQPWLIVSAILTAFVLVFILPTMTHLIALVPAAYILRYSKLVISIFWFLVIACVAINFEIAWNALITVQGLAASIICIATLVVFVLWAITIPIEIMMDAEREEYMRPKPGDPVNLYDLCAIHGKERYCIGTRDARALAPLIGIAPNEIDNSLIEMLIMRLQMDYSDWKSEYGRELSEFGDYWKATEFRRQMSLPDLSDDAVRSIYEKDLKDYEKYRQQAYDYAVLGSGKRPPFYDYWCKRDDLT